MILLLAAVLVVLLSYIILSTQKPRDFPPGPRWLPFVGSLSELKKVSRECGAQYLGLQKLAKHYNTNVLGLKLGRDGVIVVFSYALVKAVLTRSEYVGRPDNFFLRTRCLGKRRGITCMDGPCWSTQRSFLVHHLRELGFGGARMTTMISDELSAILVQIAVAADSGDGVAVNLSTVLPCAVLNVLWALMAGARIPPGDGRLDRLQELMSVRSKAFDMTGGTLSQYPWLRYLAPEKSGYNLLLRVNNQLKDFVMEPITEHFATWQPGRSDDIIYSFISEMKKDESNNSTFTIDQLVMVCIDMFIGGSQTTSNTLDYAFLMMILHPDIQIKVQNELDQAVGRSKPLEYSDRLSVPYVEAVLLETMRYFTVAPITGPRRVLSDTVLEGYNIPKESTVLISTYSVHQDKDYWGDPEEYRPERFLDQDGKLNTSDHLLSFGLGKRRCLAEVLAKNCLFMFFAGILREYKISTPEGCEKPTGRQMPGITISAEKYTAHFTKR